MIRLTWSTALIDWLCWMSSLWTFIHKKCSVLCFRFMCHVGMKVWGKECQIRIRICMDIWPLCFHITSHMWSQTIVRRKEPGASCCCSADWTVDYCYKLTLSYSCCRAETFKSWQVTEALQWASFVTIYPDTKYSTHFLIQHKMCSVTPLLGGQILPPSAVNPVTYNVSSVLDSR